MTYHFASISVEMMILYNIILPTTKSFCQNDDKIIFPTTITIFFTLLKIVLFFITIYTLSEASNKGLFNNPTFHCYSFWIIILLLDTFLLQG